MRYALWLIVTLSVVAHASVVCRTQTGLTRLLYLACVNDPFCADQYTGLALVAQPGIAVHATAPGDMVNRPLQGLLADGATLGFIGSRKATTTSRDADDPLVHIDAVVWGDAGAPTGGLLYADARAPEALDCTALTPPFSPEVDLTLRLASSALVRYRQAVVAAPLCVDSMYVRVYSPATGAFACVCRENHDCEQPKYEVALLTYLFQFDVIVVVAASAALALSTHDLLGKQKRASGRGTVG